MNADKINELYAGQIFSIETQKAARERIHWMCRQAQGQNVLDIGCSQGIVSLLLAREGFDCVGVDYERSSVEFALSELAKEEECVRRRVRFEHMNATSLCYEENSFDTVLLGEILEHLIHPERVLSEARRVLKPGGRVIITVPFGLNAAPDHKISYYPLSFLEAVCPFFRTVSVSTNSHNILFCGEKTAPGEAPEGAGAVLSGTLQLLTSLEARCLATEQTLLERSTQLYDQVRKLNEQVTAKAKRVQELEELVKKDQTPAARGGDPAQLETAIAERVAAATRAESELYAARLAEKERELAELARSSSEKLSQKDEALAALRGRVADEEGEEAALKERLEAKAHDLRHKEEEIAALQTRIDAQLAQEEALNERLVAKREMLERNEVKVADLESLNQRLLSELTRKNQEICTLMEANHQGLTQKDDELQAMLKELEAFRTEKEKELSALESDLMALVEQKEGEARGFARQAEEAAALLNEKERELEALAVQFDETLAAALRKKSKEMDDKERTLRMALHKKDKEYRDLISRKIREFELRDQNLKQLLLKSEREREEALALSLNAAAIEMELKQQAFQQAVVDKEQQLQEKEKAHAGALASLAAISARLEAKEQELREREQAHAAALEESSRAAALEVELKEAAFREALSAKAQELAEREKSHAEAVARIESEWQQRLIEKDNELKSRVEEKRREMNVALASQEELFRHAYSWRLGSVVTGAVVLASEIAKKPTLTGVHLKNYIRTVNPKKGGAKPEPPKLIAQAAPPGNASAPVLPRTAEPAVVRNDKITLGCVLDEFTADNFRPECRMVTFRPDNWKQVLEKSMPHAIFVESAWRGNDGAWLYRVAQYGKNMGDELNDLLQWGKGEKIPSFFWNKEDPVHFDRFVNRAKLFDYVFTTDADCIPRYRKELGHDRVFALPFAAQPQMQNPVLDQPREHLACFAGTYYGADFPERQKDMEYLLRPALDFGLHIYDRQFGMVGPEAEKYRFPDIYQSSIKGRLAFDEMVKAYKRYKVFLNVNSVKDSPTMFSRRVFELLACGTPVISTYSKGIQEMFGPDLVLLTESEADTRRHLERLLNDEEYWARLSVRGIRHVMEKHTYSKRMSYIFNSMGMNYSCENDPYLSVVSRVESRKDAQSLLASLGQQNYRKFELIVLKGAKVRKDDLQELASALPQVKVAVLPASSEEALRDAVAQAKTDYLCVFDPSCYYGPNYLKDYALAIGYSGANYLGKASHFERKGEQLAIAAAGREFRYTVEVPTATLAIRRDIIDLNYLPRLMGSGTFRHNDGKILSLDRFNYLHNASRTEAEAHLKSVEL